MSGLKGFSTTQKQTSSNQQNRTDFVTVQPTEEGLRQALDTVTRFAFRVGSQTVPRTAGAATANPPDKSGTIIDDASTPAMVGDYVRFETGNAQYKEIAIASVSANSFKLAANLPNPPAPGDTFYIMRYATQRMDPTGAQVTISTQGPVTYRENALAVEVFKDTTTPANSKPLPTHYIDSTGNQVNLATKAQLPAAIGPQTAAGSLAVVESANANGSNTDSTVSTVVTLTAPANTVGFILMNLDTSTTNFRWRIGAIATASSGQQLQPGRDTGYIPCSANISICAESGTCNYNIQWILRS